jgi:hypothetical protein
MTNSMPEVGKTSQAIANVFAAWQRKIAYGERRIVNIDGNNAEMRSKTPAERKGNSDCKTASESIMS